MKAVKLVNKDILWEINLHGSEGLEQCQEKGKKTDESKKKVVFKQILPMLPKYLVDIAISTSHFFIGVMKECNLVILPSLSLSMKEVITLKK